MNLFFVTRWSVVFSVYSGFLHHQNWLPRYDCNIVESGVKHPYPLSGMHSFWSLHRRSDVMYREGIFFPLRGEIIGFVCVIICMHSRWSLHKRVLVKPQRSITLDLLMMFRFKARVINNCIPTLYQVICFPVFYSYIILVFSSLNHEHNLRENLSILFSFGSAEIRQQIVYFTLDILPMQRVDRQNVDAKILRYMIIYCRLLFVLLFLFFWPLCCLSVFHWWLLVSSIFSCWRCWQENTSNLKTNM